MKMGAHILDSSKNKIMFRVFAFNKNNVSLLLKMDNEEKILVPMEKESPHIFSITVEGMGYKPLYKFRIDDEGDFPDPYSNYQPHGVHGFSQVIDHNSYPWNDHTWKGKEYKDFIIYELHVGTFTPQGNFTSIIDKLDYLLTLGINAIELMPITQTPGRWNWGYDGCNFFSINKNYGTPDDLKHLIDTCHQKKISVLLDVVYNHLGPEGNYLLFYGPYFTDKYRTPWGSAINFDDQFSFYTRKMVLDNVSYWLENFHFDGLRLDAVHAIKDRNPEHILKEIATKAKEVSASKNRKIAVIAESDENDVTLIKSPEKGGYGLDALWMDDFHHCIHTILTGDKDGYYVDYGRFTDLLKVYYNFLYSGEYSFYWEKCRGTDASNIPAHKFVVCIQNHDQVGNRANGERLSSLISFPALKTAAGLMFFSPYIPLLFMGEEYAEVNPFLFFSDYLDLTLKKKASKERKKEFKAFSWDEIPDPGDDNTFFSSILSAENKWNKSNLRMFNFYKDIIRLKKEHPALNNMDKEKVKVSLELESNLVEITRWENNAILKGLFNLGDKTISLTDREEKGWNQVINSTWQLYGGDSIKNNDEQLPGKNMIIFEPG